MSSAQIALIVVSVLVLASAAFVWFRMRTLIGLIRSKAVGEDRDYLWNLLYGLNWTGTTTNNYGFAPAESDGPERFQLQMYYELLKLYGPKAGATRNIDLLEVSCGQGGGIVHLVRNWPSQITAIGLEKSENAINNCKRTHAKVPSLSFVNGDALALPFPDGSFDVVVNVEAANDYSDIANFCSEVHRVLRPNGVFLFANTCKASRIDKTKEAFLKASFTAEFTDIAPNVVKACIEDSSRRRSLINSRVPWLYRLMFREVFENYAAVEGSKMLEKMKSGRVSYLMTGATRREVTLG